MAIGGGIIGGGGHHSAVAARVAAAAHVLFLTTAVLMLVWLLHFRGGINIQSDDPEQIFNVHPFVMCWGFILLIGEAILAYTTIPMDHRTQKMVHMLVHLVALILAIFGVYAAFKFHDAAVAPDLVSLHSWLGILAVALFGLQWLFGFFAFWLPGTHERTRAAAAPAHVAAGPRHLHARRLRRRDGTRPEERRRRVRRRGQAHQRHRHLHPALRRRRRRRRRAPQGLLLLRRGVRESRWMACAARCCLI
ncbi:hypothetical protein OsJ_12356 [Oryza sativa Japonica Group]|uniref:Cytochrome b561 domain-containing protein n=1 Tax=Oryza sativa subsp. japonica TaxID=39947 RepID=A3AM37_ORYSJ|nr:hypothetical protein OsJ_12356 [Oryza sativa Japonica Group]